jgi:hypothetical protein
MNKHSTVTATAISVTILAITPLISDHKGEDHGSRHGGREDIIMTTAAALNNHP